MTPLPLSAESQLPVFFVSCGSCRSWFNPTSPNYIFQQTQTAAIDLRTFSLISTNRFVYIIAMPRELPRPTESELAILRILWRQGPCTVRQVVDLSEPGTGYTTILKLLQIMTEKGLVTRDDTDRSHVFSPAQPEETTQRQLVDDLLDRAFGGSSQKLVLQALAGRRPSAAELRELRTLLNNLESSRS